MKFSTAIAFATVAVAVTTLNSQAREKPAPRGGEPVITEIMSMEEAPRMLGALRSTATLDTTEIGEWHFNSFPSCTDQGWTPVDATAVLVDYWHVDDFDGLGGGTFGGLTPVEGLQSLWLGARPTGLENLDLCRYATLPGYGNAWSQKWCTATCLNVSTGVEVVFLGRWDSEPGYDGTTVQVSTCTDGMNSDRNWLPVRPIASPGGHFDDVSGVDSLVIEAVPDSFSSNGTVAIQIRLLFESDGGWSDEDGLWDTDGGIIIDSLSVVDNDGVVLAVEDFEGEAVGATSANDWEGCSTVAGFSAGNTAGNYPGTFADLFPGLSLVQEDPCVSEIDCMWAFVAGSTDDYSCGGFPGQAVVPFGPNSDDLYFREEIWSPIVSYTGTSTDVELVFHMYPDLPLDNLVFFNWAVRSVVDGCPGEWRDDSSGANRAPQKTWVTVATDIADKLEPGATEFQVRLEVRDWCALSCGTHGTGSCHSHGPLYDWVRIYAIEQTGPGFNWKAGGMPNDNFASDGTLTGTCRFDAAGDILPSANPSILVGDSATIVINEPLNGLNTGVSFYGGDLGTWAATYAIIGTYDVTGAKNKYSAAQLTDDTFRWPVVDSVTAPDASTWYVVRLDTAFSSPGRIGNVLNTFCFDLNDDLFVPGDEIRYFLGAQSGDGEFNYYYMMETATDIKASWAPSTTQDINVAFANYREVTMFPTQHLRAEPGDILFVDNWNERGVEPFFNTAFEQMGLLDKIDRYDTGQSGSSAAGWFGARVENTAQQLIPVYRKIIWSSGTDQSRGNIGDGSSVNKADEFADLYEFVDQHPNGGGIYFSGDGIASAWDELIGASATTFRSTYMNFNVVTSEHATIMEVSPLMIGEPGSCFDGASGPDTMVAYGGCPTLEMFDVLDATGNSVVEMTYNGNSTNAAILSQVTANSAGDTARVMLAGVSLHQFRDYAANGVPARSDHLFDVITWLDNAVQTPTQVRTTGLVNSLSQNYPNPFNPTTTIEFALREQSPVRLKIYNVAGQLVRTLVDDVRTPGVVHSISWDGTNAAGQQVSSGVYFYKLTSKDFVQTKKMVLLK